MQYTITEIADIIKSEEKPTIDLPVRLLLTDSRSVVFPEESLFFAIKTKTNDGHNYIAELYQRGVTNFVINRPVNEQELTFTGANFLHVPDSLKALQELAAFHRKRFSVPVIGITGSNGKTVVKEWLYQLLHPDKNIVRSPRSYNSRIGVPLSVWQLDEETELGIFEAGISERKEMDNLERIISPDICILTNIGEAHQENFSGPEEKCMEKLKLAMNSGCIIYNADSVCVDTCVRQKELSARLFYWSKKDKTAPVFIKEIITDTLSTEVKAVYEEKEYVFSIPFSDEASLENAIHCFAFLLYRGLPASTIRERMALLEPVGMRMEVKEGKNDCVIINDSYNSDILSLDIALDFMLRRDKDKKLTHTLILSDILQSGMDTKKLAERIYDLVTVRKIDKLIAIGNQLFRNKDIFEGIETLFFRTTSDFLHSVHINLMRNEIVLIKGSRNFHFERISEVLELKVHETILEVDLNAIVHNYNFYRSGLHPSTQMICMVKAFAYGAGSYEIAKTLQDQQCNYLAVAVADEGAELRRNGINLPVMVMNPEMTAFRTILNNQLEPEIYSFRLLKAFIKEADKQGIYHYPVHLKIDTGMHRLGFSSADIPELGEFLKKQSNLVVKSVFSHLAGSDEMQLKEFTKEQIDLFIACANQLEEVLGYKPMRHILNSEGIVHYPEYQMDMVRLGLGLYGIGSVSGLKNVTTLKTTILQIREVEAGETVGYGRKGEIKAPSRIATLPVGYADGMNRKLGNGNAEVWINGKFAPTIGNICMDLTMVDVTGISCEEGDTVIIFGEVQPPSVLAEKLETIPYEIITSVSDRVKRIYFTE
ncbi:MAG: bifunctional UDP-N-acetylmuramoyl-tripeptide:D-alanyl-D-alanine ligase/alanine racemase [Candidatus Azobacteroides sp.]|nr:bifunctional UDP-N-acetylmuramoyl-tripeptide:D-alanyl-D-alanine ligase/alanine racemase [Candidatus Azobacteroides sp.]